jgi:putative restriction endonuclease
MQESLYPALVSPELTAGFQTLEEAKHVKLYVGITDYDWFKLHSSKPIVEEVNFWKPSSQLGFKVLQWGEPFLFKLHAPRNFIVGGGFFTKFLRLPVSLAWETFGEANGARSLDEVRVRIAKYRKQPIGPTEDPVIGCILLEEPFFFEERDWIPIPSDFKAGIQMGKSYDMETGTGLMLWRGVTERLQQAKIRSIGPATEAATELGARFGKPQIITPRLGQGSFRLLVADAYGRRCTMTGERTLPALEAAHIHRYSRGGDHSLSNGLLLRSDLHKLFDLGYLTVEPTSLKIKVSKRIKEEFENGRIYYDLDNQELRQPENQLAFPSIKKLNYHYENEFRG